MITLNETICAVESLSALGIVLYLRMRLYPMYHLDQFRQTMFSVRDELFDYAAEGKISFTDPAYRVLRQSMNAYLRYGHRLTFGQLLFTILHWRLAGDQPTPDEYNQLDTAIQSIADPEVRKALEGFHRRAMLLVMRHLVTGSFLLTTFVVFFVLNNLVTEGITNLHQSLRAGATVVINKLVDPRLIEGEARRYAKC